MNRSYKRCNHTNWFQANKEDTKENEIRKKSDQQGKHVVGAELAGEMREFTDSQGLDE